MLDRATLKRRLYHYGLGVGLPYSMVRGVADRIDEVAHIKSVGERRQAARALLSRVKPAVQIEAGKAYALIGPEQFPEIPDIVKLSQQIVDERSKDLPPLKGQNTFWHLLRPGDVAGRYRPLLDFALSERMIATVSDHLGMVPRLFYLNVWLSPPLPKMVGSHRYHLDKPDGEILSVFINVNDVGINAGPFTFIPGDVSGDIVKKTRYDLIYYRGGKRLEDDEVERASSAATAIQLKGPSGSGGMVNTSRCLHLGSRCIDQSRIVYVAKFALAHKVPPYSEGIMDGHPYSADPLRSLLLEGTRPA